MMIAKRIYCEELEPYPDETVTVFGRNFAQGGGVSAAVAQVNNEKEKPAIKAVYADGCFECKKQLMLMRAGKFDADILEGMCCVGGCINGPASIEQSLKTKVRMNKENAVKPKITVSESVEYWDFSKVDMHREK